MSDHEFSTQEEINDVKANSPHVLLLGAGASKAALPTGDKHGKAIPLLRDVAEALSLANEFPNDLRDLAITDFEGAYSKLFERGCLDKIQLIDSQVRDFFIELELPDEPNLYDVINLSLRKKDVILTFNWDPFLIQSRLRLSEFGIGDKLPYLIFFLHGNVATGYCEKDNASGISGAICGRCHERFAPSKLLYPVEHKDYQSDPFIRREWTGAVETLSICKMFTIFGYSAPRTDKEAVSLFKNAWGDSANRNLEQIEVIDRPGADEDNLRETWKSFIHTHHYQVHDSFYESFIGTHPRRSIESWWNQFLEAKFLEGNPVPKDFRSLADLVDWFRPLFVAEDYKENAEGPF